ncbi:MAG: thiosulfate oxidation carrier protein SoxY [Betaproteobacteria bacterium]|nr:thiosulfate oxidation carrier protein SoxY [Betaproteobacteria bacterium]
MERRDFLRQGGGSLAAALLGAGWLTPAQAAEWNRVAFEAKGVDVVFRLLGAGDATASGDVYVTAPEIAENGAVVPVTVGSRLPGTQSIAILIEKNPNTLTAMFDIPQGTAPEVHTRVKMAETCRLYALVRTENGFHFGAKEIKITLGGCGG